MDKYRLALMGRVQFDGTEQVLCANKSIVLDVGAHEENDRHKIANSAFLLLLSSYELLIETDVETVGLISEYCRLALLTLQIDEGN